MIRFVCQCGKHISTPDGNAGRRGKCPQCGAVIRIPQPPQSDVGRSPDPPVLSTAALSSVPPPHILPPMPVVAPPPQLPLDNPPPVSGSNPGAGFEELPPWFAELSEPRKPATTELASPRSEAGGLTPFPDLSSFGNSPNDFADKCMAIIDAVKEFRFSTAKDAKLAKSHISQGQKMLRQVKKEIAAKVRMSNATFDNAATRASQNYGIGDFGTALLFGSGFVRSNHAAKRAGIKMEKANVAATYNSVKSLIDSAIIELDRAKLQIDDWISSNR
jgi:hypothetical protein